MALAYHIVFGAYGFWLPNDPRGSWTEFVANWELLRFGSPKKHTSRQSTAHVPHDKSWHTRAKTVLKYPPAVFTGKQALEIGHGFAESIAEGPYVCLACAIMPEHVHIVLARHARAPSRMAGHLKSAATRRLRAAGMWPADRPVWGENCWKVFLDDEEDVARAIVYTNHNPIREGKRPQRWSFVTPWS